MRGLCQYAHVTRGQLQRRLGPQVVATTWSSPRGRRSRLLTALVAMIVSIASPNPLSPTASAAVACGDTVYVNRFDGNYSSSQLYGVRGTIRDRPILLCSNAVGATSGAAVWVMHASTGSAPEYAQVGDAKLPGMAAPQAFTEYNDGSTTAPGWARSFYAGIWSNGSQQAYKVDYNGITGKIYLIIDSLTKASTPWSPDTEWHGGWEGEFYAETLDRGDDVPGPGGARTDMSALVVQKCDTCAFVNPDGLVLTSDLTPYKSGWSASPTAFQIWTQR